MYDGRRLNSLKKTKKGNGEEAGVSVLASRNSSKEEYLWACGRVCALSSRCSESQLQSFMRAGGTSAITALLKSSDEDIVDAAAAALTNLSSPSVRAPEDKVFDFNGMLVRVKEMSFSQSGTAYNVWTAAMVLAQWMTMSADFAAKNLHSKKVLELGSGLGVCGIVAAKLGREADCEVTLSDFLPHVLDNLQTSIASNGIEHCARCVRLNWADEAGVTGACSNQGWYAGEYDAATDQDANRHLTLKDKEQFDLIIGSDICYENDHPVLLEHVVRRRLAPGGRLIFVYAVRFPALHSEMLDRLGTFCSEVSSESLDSKEGPYGVDIIEEGCSQHSNKYAGGMRLVSAFRGGQSDCILTEACGVTGESEFN